MRTLQPLPLLAVATAISACESDDPTATEPVVTSVAPVSGIPATFADAVAGAELHVSVLVSTASGPASNVLVSFAPSGAGTVTSGGARTGADGRASTVWKVEPTVGSNTRTVTAEGKTTPFSAVTRAGPAARLMLHAGNNQSTAVASAVPVAPSVRITDANDNLVTSPVVVTFTVTSGGGTLNAGAASANVPSVNGVTSVTTWTLGATAGTGNNVITASSTGLIGSPVTFTASARAGAAASLSINAGNNQTAVAGTTVPVPPSVLVKDAFGNPAADVDVTFAVSQGGGTVAPEVVKTKAAGVATVTGWVLGTAVGANALSVSAPGHGAVTLGATGIAGAAARVQKLAGDGGTAAAGTILPTAPSVRVTDTNGNGVALVSVTFAVSAGGGTILGPATIQSDAAGIATLGGWQLGGAAGSNALTASSGTLVGSPLTFTATGTKAPVSVTVSAGNNQTAVAGSAVATAPSVVVRDALGNPIADVDVLFTVTAGGGTIHPTTEVRTNAQGVAQATGWALGTSLDGNPNTLSASVPGTSLAPALFTAAAVAGPAAAPVPHAGDGQAAAAGTPVPIAPAVRVLDSNNNPVGAGTSVTFAVESGGGSITGPATVQTNAHGIATVGGWVLGPSTGTNSLSATSGSLIGSPVTFNATATQTATSLAINAGNNQSATVATAVTTPPSEIVRDVLNSPVANVDVTFAVTAGGGAVVPATVVKTNAQGVATVTRWTLGATAGANALRASAAGLTPVTFAATGTAGAAATLSLSAGDNQSAEAGTAVSIAPSVRVTDSHNNAVGAGTSVTFAMASGGGSITAPATVQTNAAGIATVG